MREPVYLVLHEINRGVEYQMVDSRPSLAEARNAASQFALDNPGLTYAIAPIGQAVTAEIATRWDE